MNIKELFNKDPNQSIDEIIKLTKNNPLSKRILFDFEMKKFGNFTLNEIIQEYKVKKIVHKNIDIEPLNIIASSHHPHFCYIPIIKLYLEKLKRKKYLKHFSNYYFFSNLNTLEPLEDIVYYIINDKNGSKKYIIKHGHHRSFTGYFLQIIDSSYKFKGISAIEFVIDWTSINTKKNINIFNNKKYFDYEEFEKFII